MTEAADSRDDGLRARVRARIAERFPATGADAVSPDDVERAIFNKAIRRCRFNASPCCWANVVFRECYTSVALSAIANADALAAAMGAGASPADAVLKSPAEMRPDIWRELVENKRERDSAYSARPAANTTMYRCRRCESRQCHSFGLQTRSGDEPMTVFISCLNCGNRWRTEG